MSEPSAAACGPPLLPRDFASVDRISEPSDIRQTDCCSCSAEQAMNTKMNFPVALAFSVLSALPWPAAAQAPPRNHEISSIWSSESRSLHELDLLTSRALDELVPFRSSRLIIGVRARWPQDTLTCEPQRWIAIDP